MMEEPPRIAMTIDKILNRIWFLSFVKTAKRTSSPADAKTILTIKTIAIVSFFLFAWIKSSVNIFMQIVQ